MQFQKVTIIGVGLIGGSLALAIKKAELAETVVGVDQRANQLQKAVARGAIDAHTCDAGEGVKDADLVILATPVGAFESIVRFIAPKLISGCIVTDVGSTKEVLVKQMEQILPQTAPFVGGHPIAGKEKSGIEAASGDLFKGARCILTSTARTNRQALEKVKGLWEEVGSEVVIMEPLEHDRILAAISHLPHIVAYALVNTALDLFHRNGKLFSLSGGGFKDFTRIAASSPEMWRDICLHNSENIVATLDAFETVLERIKRQIKDRRGNELRQEFEKAKKLREGIG